MPTDPEVLPIPHKRKKKHRQTALKNPVKRRPRRKANLSIRPRSNNPKKKVVKQIILGKNLKEKENAENETQTVK